MSRSAPAKPARIGPMDRCLHLGSVPARPDWPADVEDDICFPPALVAAFLDEFSLPGEVVLDPFAGFGTTLEVCNGMGRRAIGVELLPERAEFIRSRIGPPAEIHCADARELDALPIGPVQFVMTSPPYMTKTHHRQNPLNGYRSLDGDYDTYLGELASVFAQVATILEPGRHAAINVANLRFPESGFTPLAWDVASRVGEVLDFEHEIVLCWDHDQPGITQDYCLVFRRPKDARPPSSP